MHHQRSAWAPSDQRQHRPARARQERPVGDAHLDEAADQQAGVQQRPSAGSDPRRSRRRRCASAQRRCRCATRPARPPARAPTATIRTATRPALVIGSPPQQHQLGAEARAHGHQHAGATRRPAAGRVRESSASTCSTEADDRLPTCGQRRPGRLQRLVRQVEAAAAIASSTFGPPGCATQRVDVGRLEVVVGEEAATSSPRLRLDDVGDARRRARSGSRCRRCPSPSPARCRGRAGCGWRRPAAPAQARARSARRSPTMTTAAAPSPNSPLATRLAIEASSRWTVSEHSSTESSTATPSGSPTQVVVHPGDARRRRRRSRARRSGIRLTSGRSPSTRHQPGVQARRRDAGDRRGDHEVDVAPVQAGRGERVADRLVRRARCRPR